MDFHTPKNIKLLQGSVNCNYVNIMYRIFSEYIHTLYFSSKFKEKSGLVNYEIYEDKKKKPKI